MVLLPLPHTGALFDEGIHALELVLGRGEHLEHPSFGKQALIVDDRYNGGGYVSQMVINRLRNALIAFGTSRYVDSSVERLPSPLRYSTIST